MPVIAEEWLEDAAPSIGMRPERGATSSRSYSETPTQLWGPRGTPISPNPRADLNPAQEV